MPDLGPEFSLNIRNAFWKFPEFAIVKKILYAFINIPSFLFKFLN